MTLDFPLIWAALLAFAVLAYVVLYGFDLGVGLLSPFARDEHERDRMMNTIAQEWDGNETWLVMGGGGLLGAFVQGIVGAGRAYAGGAWDWLSPFSVATGIALIIGYALLGATWLVMMLFVELQLWVCCCVCF